MELLTEARPRRLAGRALQRVKPARPGRSPTFEQPVDPQHLALRHPREDPRVDLRPDDARVSTDEQDLTAQREALAGLGVAPERIYIDHGLTGTTRARSGLREVLAACHDGGGPGSPAA
jgi:hypothetical protein